jgi:hypothetical protein
MALYQPRRSIIGAVAIIAVALLAAVIPELRFIRLHIRP